MLVNALEHIVLDATSWDQLMNNSVEHSPEQRVSLWGGPHWTAKRVTDAILDLAALLRLSRRTPAVTDSCVIRFEERKNKVVIQFIPNWQFWPIASHLIVLAVNLRFGMVFHSLLPVLLTWRNVPAKLRSKFFKFI
jgi:hypothetical protein